MAKINYKNGTIHRCKITRINKIHYMFKQPDIEGSTRCSVIINGETIFSAEKAMNMGSNLVECYCIDGLFKTPKDSKYNGNELEFSEFISENNLKLLKKTLKNKNNE